MTAIEMPPTGDEQVFQPGILPRARRRKLMRWTALGIVATLVFVVGARSLRDDAFMRCMDSYVDEPDFDYDQWDLVDAVCAGRSATDLELLGIGLLIGATLCLVGWLRFRVARRAGQTAG